MKLFIDRGESTQEYNIELGSPTLLEALVHIRENIDNSLAFDHGCRSGVCGSCAVRVNGEELLACQYDARSGDFIEPLKNLELIKDLKADKSISLDILKRTRLSPIEHDKHIQTAKNESKTMLQSSCILCYSCYSACPALDENEEFLGPFALTRVYRYLQSNSSESKTEILEHIQQDGIWDCVLCSACTDVCPKHIDPKDDIDKLAKMSLEAGYQNPKV